MIQIQCLLMLAWASLLHTAIATPIAAAPPTPSGACKFFNTACTADGFKLDYYGNNFAGGYGNTASGDASNYYIVQRRSLRATTLFNTTFFDSVSLPTNTPVYPNSSYPNTPYWPGWKRTITGTTVTVDANNFTLIYSGVFKAPSTGAWQICARSDDETDVYFGHQNAFDCSTQSAGTAANPVLLQAYDGNGNFGTQKCVTQNLVQGAVYPIRVVYGQSQAISTFELKLVAPGQQPADGTTDWSGYIFPRDCASN